jgi:putative tricarboxylic transport membrane protein
MVFGFIGYLLSRYQWPGACMVLGLVLGDLVEANFHRSVLIGGGSYMILFTRPFSVSIFLLTMGMLIWPAVKHWVFRADAVPPKPEDEESAIA